MGQASTETRYFGWHEKQLFCDIERLTQLESFGAVVWAQNIFVGRDGEVALLVRSKIVGCLESRIDAGPTCRWD